MDNSNNNSTPTTDSNPFKVTGNEAVNPPVVVQPTVSSNSATTMPPVVTGIAPNVETSPINDPPQKFTTRLKIISILAGVAIILLALIGYAVFSTSNSEKSPSTAVFQNAYDSPFGIMPPWQTDKIKNGKFSLTTNYVTGKDITRTGNLYVNDKGNIVFELIPDAQKVNKLITYLHAKNDPRPFALSADQNISFDFQSLLGYYDSLYEDGPINSLGGYLNDVKLATRSLVAKDKEGFTLGKACSESVTAAEKLTGSDALTTNKLGITVEDRNGRNQVRFNESILAAADRSLPELITKCFDINGKYKDLYLQEKNYKTVVPQITYWQEDAKSDKWRMTIAYDNLKFDFTISDLNTVKAKSSGTFGSFKTSTNRFGLAYSTCRAVPIIYRNVAAVYNYKFIAEDVSYGSPSKLDAGYVCSTEDVPTGYSHASEIAVDFPDKKVKATFNTQQGINEIRVHHDLGYRIELFRQEYGYYPESSKLTSLADELPSLAPTARQLITENKILYVPTPLNCENNCTNYTLDYKASNLVTFSKTAYIAN